MKSLAVPRPVPDEQTAGFWAAVAQGRLTVQRCRACATSFLPPRYICEHCDGFDFEFVSASGHGAINSVTFVHVARHPAFEASLPYPVELITLDDYPELTLLANMRGTPAEDIVVGQPVEFFAFDLGDGCWIPEFRLRNG